VCAGSPSPYSTVVGSERQAWIPLQASPATPAWAMKTSKSVEQIRRHTIIRVIPIINPLVTAR
jgi:hypothetical protein